MLMEKRASGLKSSRYRIIFYGGYGFIIVQMQFICENGGKLISFIFVYFSL